MANNATELKPISVTACIRLANSARIQHCIEQDAVLSVYNPLVAHFAKIKQMQWDEVVVGLHIVFAWMPRMIGLKDLAIASPEQKRQVSCLLLKVKQGHQLSLPEVKTLMNYTNKSCIGLSKLLHFICPSKYPIWDQRTARAFTSLKRKPPYSFVRTAEAYLRYQSTLLKWTRARRLAKHLNALRRFHHHLRAVSDMRLIELVLWHAGKSR